MSDLFCPATLLVARHGKASYAETWFSDEGGWLSSEGRAQARALAERVRARKVSRIWCSDTSRTMQTAEIVAAEIGLSGDSPVVADRRLREIFIGDLLGSPFDVALLHAVTDHWFGGDLERSFPGGESGQDVVDRYAAQLAEIADQHRGEAVLVVVHQTAASLALPALCDNVALVAGREHQLANGDYAEIEGDADGWRLVSWGHDARDLVELT